MNATDLTPNIEAFKKHVADIAANPDFIHHKWFVQWHLQIVERLALELCEHYPDVDRELIEVMAWLHDYGKILDFDNQYDRKLLDKGHDKLLELGFDSEFANKAADYIEWMDKKLEVDIHEAPIEVQILSSADGASHLVTSFMHFFWYENADKPVDEVMAGNLAKARKDWERKITLPEAKTAFKKYYEVALVQAGELPEKFL
jgi:hypothetical protein